MNPPPSRTSPYANARVAQATWGSLTVAQRVAHLTPAIDYLLRELEPLAGVIHAENGKPVVEAIAHEIMPSIAYLRWLQLTAPEILRERRRPLAWLPHRACTVARRPFGVTLVIAPWNIPFYIPFSQVVTALVGGNAVVLKPSEVTPLTGGRIADVLAGCGLPPDLFTVVQGGGAVGARLIKGRPDKVVFTGSVATGRKVMAAAAAHPIPVSLELGGIDAAVVCEDADLDYVASAIAWGGTFNHGQVCASVERVLAHEAVHDELLERIADKMERINIHEDYGRVTFVGQKTVLNEHLADAERRGLHTHCGGRWLDAERLAPTLYGGAAVAGSDVWREESFGPIVAALAFATDDEAVALHNDTTFGLTASVFSADLPRAQRIASQLRAGNVSINDLGALHYSQPELPWGGVGDSGFGRSHGEEGLLSATWPQVIDASRLGASEPKRPWWYPYDNQLTRAMTAFTHLVGARTPRDKAVRLGRTALEMSQLLSGTRRN